VLISALVLGVVFLATTAGLFRWAFGQRRQDLERIAGTRRTRESPARLELVHDMADRLQELWLVAPQTSAPFTTPATTGHEAPYSEEQHGRRQARLR
jgi:hypothetical protein